MPIVKPLYTHNTLPAERSMTSLNLYSKTTSSRRPEVLWRSIFHGTLLLGPWARISALHVPSSPYTKARVKRPICGAKFRNCMEITTTRNREVELNAFILFNRRWATTSSRSQRLMNEIRPKQFKAPQLHNGRAMKAPNLAEKGILNRFPSWNWP